MNTTSLFVELIVIGLGAGIWILLVTLTLFGYQWIPSFNETYLLPLAIPTLAIIYVIGIVSDRMIDILFNHLWGKKIRLQSFPDVDQYHQDRRTVRTSSDAMSQVIEYSRSRLRICRGWTVHSFLIAISIFVFAWIRIPDRQLALGVLIYGATVFGFLGFSCWYAWRYLNTTQYLKIRDVAAYLNPSDPNHTEE